MSLLCVAYSSIGFHVAQRLGLFRDPEAVLFETNDSRIYLQLSDYLTGRSDTIPPVYLSQLSDYVAGRSESPPVPYFWRRPVLYPLFLSSYRILGGVGFILLQWCCTLATLALTFHAIRILTGSVLISILGSALLAIQPSFGLVALHALTESLSLVLLSAFVWFLTLFHCRGNRSRHLFVGIFLLSAAACVKPAYLPLLVLWVPFAVCWTVRRRGWGYGTAWRTALAVSPVLLQLGWSIMVLGQPSLAGSGKMNFQHRYFPVVCGFGEQGEFVPPRDTRTADCRAAYPEVTDKIGYMVAHPLVTLRATAHLLRNSLVAPSPFTHTPFALIVDKALSARLKSFSAQFNTVMLTVHAIALLSLLPLLAVGTIPRESSRLFLWLGLFTGLVLLLSCLSINQGDRLILAAAPLWTVLYSALLGLPFGAAWHRSSVASGSSRSA